MASKKINTILTLKDKMSQPLTKVSKNVGTVTRDMKKSQNQIEKWKNKGVKAMDDVIRKTAKVVGAAGALAGAFAIKVGFDGMLELDDASAKVKSIAKESLKMEDIQKDLLKSSNATGIVIEELGEAQYSAISAGVKAFESMDAAVTSSKLAIAGFTDTDSALKGLTSTMNVFGLEGTDAMQGLSDKFLVTQNLGVTTVGELANGLGDITPIAKSAGMGIDDMLSSIASLTKGGMSTDAAITNLKGVMTSFIKPSKESAKMAKKLGIDMSVSAIESKGFGKVMEEIKEKTGGNTEVMGKLFGNVRGLSAALSLTSDTGMADFNNTLEEMKNSAGETDKAYETMTNTMGFKFDKMKNRVKNTFTEIMNSQSGSIGEMLDKMDSWLENNEEKIQGWIEAVGQGINKAKEFVGQVVDFIKEHEQAITTVLLFIGTIYAVMKVAAVLKGVLAAVNVVMMVLNGTLLLSPFTWVAIIIGLVVAAGYLLCRNWETVMEWAGKLKETVVENFTEFKDGIIDSVKDAWEGVKEWFGKIKEFISNPIKGTIDLVQNVKENRQAKKSEPAFAKGTSYSPAGFARINEEGGEIRKLSSGETIIPADKSDRLLKNKSTGQDVSVKVEIQGNVIGNKQFINEVGNEVYTKVKLALSNI